MNLFKIFILISPLLFLCFSNKALASQGNPDIYYVEEENTIYVSPTQDEIETIVNLRDIYNTIDNENILREESPKVWILNANLWIKGVSAAEKEIILQLTDETVTWLKLESNDLGFIWLKTYNGNFFIQNIKITSWDSISETFDTNYENGRSFILVKYNSRMDIADSELAYLGYSDGESYGVSWRIAEGTLGQYLVTGEVSGSDFHHNYFGAYSFGAQGMVFKNNEFHHNIQYGLDPHDDSNGFLVEENIFYENGNHGLIFSKRCINNIIRNNISRNNALSGMMLDKQSNNNIVENNTAYGNVNGIAIYESDNNTIKNNAVYQNERGILLKDQPTHNTIEENQIYGNSQYGIYFYSGATENTILNNNIYSNIETGIYIKSFNNIIGPGNLIHDNGYGVSFYEPEANGNTVKENQIYENKKDGVAINYNSQNIVENNGIYENSGGSGVRIRQGTDNEIKNNEIYDNYYQGIYIYENSNYNEISGNNIYNNLWRGIYVAQSNNNEINNNTVTSNNSYGIYLYGISSFNNVYDNTVEGNSRGIYLKEAVNNNTFERNSIFNNAEEGLYVYSSALNTIRDNDVYNNKIGIRLQLALENVIANNDAHDNFEQGIGASIGSDKNIIFENKIYGNDKYGVYISDSSENDINSNTIAANNQYGIYFYNGSNQNTAFGNTVESHEKGVYIKLSNDNEINQNIIRLNSYAVYLYEAQNNIFVENALLDNINNYYYAKFQANNIIKDTNSMAVKIADDASSMTIISAENYVFKNSKDLSTVADSNKTSILLTRAITGSVATFEKLNFKVIPSLSQVNVAPLTWETTSDYYKKWTEAPVAASMGIKHEIGDLNPNTNYSVFMDGELLNNYTSSDEGWIEFTCNSVDVFKKVFEIKEKS